MRMGWELAVSRASLLLGFLTTFWPEQIKETGCFGFKDGFGDFF
jgi:hypothetical protein